MKTENHYHQSNKRLALTNINQLVRNIFCNCHQLPTWRNTHFTQNRDYFCPTVWTLTSNPPSGESDVKPQKTNISKQNDPQLEHLSPCLDNAKTPLAVHRDRNRSDQKQFPGKTSPKYHIELTLSPSILGPVYLCFSKGVCSSIASARDRLDQKQPPRETLTSPDDNSNDLAKTTTYPLSVSHTPNPFSSPPVAKITIDLLSVSHTFNPLLSPLAKITTYPLSVSHTLNPFSSPPVSAKEHVSVTPNSAKTIKLEHHYFSLYLTQITDFTEPPSIRPKRRYDSNLAHLAPLKHGFLIFRMNRTRRCEPRLEQQYFTLYFTLFSELTEPTNFRPRHRYDPNVAHLAPPKHGILILNG